MKNLFLIIGGILLAIAVFLFYREQSFISKAETVTGHVVDLDRSHDSDDGTDSFCPVVDFNTKKGEPVRFFGNVCSNPPAYNIGDPVQLLYDPQDIKHVQMDGFWGKWVGTLVFAFIGVPFFVLGLYVSFSGNKKKGK